MPEFPSSEVILGLVPRIHTPGGGDNVGAVVMDCRNKSGNDSRRVYYAVAQRASLTKNGGPMARRFVFVI